MMLTGIIESRLGVKIRSSQFGTYCLA